VLVIAPAGDNAPSSGFAQLGRSQELLYRHDRYRGERR
jgi:hypothetical protein